MSRYAIDNEMVRGMFRLFDATEESGPSLADIREVLQKTWDEVQPKNVPPIPPTISYRFADDFLTFVAVLTFSRGDEITKAVARVVGSRMSDVSTDIQTSMGTYQGKILERLVKHSIEAVSDLVQLREPRWTYIIPPRLLFEHMLKTSIAKRKAFALLFGDADLEVNKARAKTFFAPFEDWIDGHSVLTSERSNVFDLNTGDSAGLRLEIEHLAKTWDEAKGLANLAGSIWAAGNASIRDVYDIRPSKPTKLLTSISVYFSALELLSEEGEYDASSRTLWEMLSLRRGLDPYVLPPKWPEPRPEIPPHGFTIGPQPREPLVLAASRGVRDLDDFILSAMARQYAEVSKVHALVEANYLRTPPSTIQTINPIDVAGRPMHVHLTELASFDYAMRAGAVVFPVLRWFAAMYLSSGILPSVLPLDIVQALDAGVRAVSTSYAPPADVGAAKRVRFETNEADVLTRHYTTNVGAKLFVALANLVYASYVVFMQATEREASTANYVIPGPLLLALAYTTEDERSSYLMLQLVIVHHGLDRLQDDGKKAKDTVFDMARVVLYDAKNIGDAMVRLEALKLTPMDIKRGVRSVAKMDRVPTTMRKWFQLASAYIALISYTPDVMLKPPKEYDLDLTSVVGVPPQRAAALSVPPLLVTLPPASAPLLPPQLVAPLSVPPLLVALPPAPAPALLPLPLPSPSLPPQVVALSASSDPEVLRDAAELASMPYEPVIPTARKRWQFERLPRVSRLGARHWARMAPAMRS